MNPLIVEELDRIPRGDLAQNAYRAAYVDVRQNALGLKPKIGPDPQDAHTLALRIVRAQFPGSTPELLR